jgi:hypothetical protein
MAYEKGKPEPGIKAKFLDDRVRGNNDFIQPAINNEHNFVDADAGNQSGDHTQGSARCFSQDTAPTTRIDGSSFVSTDLGSLWVDTDDNALYILTAITPTWTPVSDEVIAVLLAANRVFAGTLGVTDDFAVNTDKFNISATTGDTLVAGTLGVTGVLTTTAPATLGDGSILAAATENSDPDRTISDKAYVDSSDTDGFNPTTESGATSSIGVTVFPNGLRIAYGSESVASAAEDTITPIGFTSIYSVTATLREDNNTDRSAAKLGNINNSTFTIRNTNSQTHIYNWICIGR